MNGSSAGGASTGEASAARFLLSGATNNPNTSWLDYFGLPDDLGEWTIDDVRSTVATMTITVADFEHYLATVGEPFRFLATHRPNGGGGGGGGEGEALSNGHGGGAAGNGGRAIAADVTERLGASPQSCAVPQVVFEERFDLTDPSTFAVFSPEGAPHATLVTIERMTNYLDQVEITLLGEVSSRAEGFFEALVSYDRLGAEVEAGVRQLAAMRERLRDLETNLVHQPLHLPRLVRRRSNTVALDEKLRLLLAVVQTQPTIHQLLAAGDFPGALELIASSQSLLASELSGVSSLAGIATGLEETKAVIERTMAHELMEVALGYDPSQGPPAMPVEALSSELDVRLELEPRAYEGVMASIAAPLLVLLRRASAIDATLQRASSELCGGLCDIAAERLCALADDFAADVAHLSGRGCAAVSAEAAAQAKAFVDALLLIHYFIRVATKKLEATVEQEAWGQVEVPAEYQRLVDSIAANQVPEAPPASAADHLSAAAAVSAAVGSAEAEPEAERQPSRASDIVVSGAGYKVVGSGLILLSTVVHYLQCGAAVPAVAPPIAHALPVLLRGYHTHAYKQVLMAGAMLPTSAGLKSISFKHLALSSQSLGVLLALLPHLKAILAAYLPEAQRHALKEFDGVESDLEAHQQQIFAKFVSILEERRRGRVKDLSAALAPPQAGAQRQPEPSANIKAVAADLRAVYKTLRDLLTPQQLHKVFELILTAFDAGLLEAYRGVDTAPAFSRQCIVQDVQFLRKEVARLHLSLPSGCCPNLVAFALALPTMSSFNVTEDERPDRTRFGVGDF
ncbi:vacuolar protein sorting 54 [Emiliania huxleyi CCMP1516]|uniref:Vacuolar protein sorting-associated protein 54 n=2 Tax=Emiliania huxleyi TaxID=2903 RepID=A0A0D3IDA9_EMIH1|nr:vacuolar protein sorting 54 [Emiliania huxleyi CCMP1516]EOD09244.1 vacuolar protein sorting 54 [Emiliania huxleyi CCMP1516]|eukprot:XP_005761673.1 vacuolar protein sorting 54 [Emiliania huxleyi CCMP1516]